jgi:diaminohydroxyphosphoribosylaminopyrimidine deaminase/5-amino-6-(5-phosphoribosylamino)uracil reductase
MVGAGTAATDDPRLDVRLPGLEDRAPMRVVLDGGLRIPASHDLVARAGSQPTLLFTRAGHPPERRQALADQGMEVLDVESDDEGLLSVSSVLQELGRRGLTRLLVEGGGRLAASLIRADLVDRLVWFRAPGVIGGDGVPAVAGFGLAGLADMPRFQRLSAQPAGADLVETYARDP